MVVALVVAVGVRVAGGGAGAAHKWDFTVLGPVKVP